MIATCKFCQTLITPGAVLQGVPKAQLAKIPPQQLEVMLFSQAVTQHMHGAHPDYMESIKVLVHNVVGSLTLCTVTPAGEGADAFNVLTQADKDLLVLVLQAAPNPADPAAIQAIHKRVADAQAGAIAGRGSGSGLVDAGGNPVSPVIRLGGSLDGGDVN